MKLRLFALLGLFAFAESAIAQVQPDDVTTRLVGEVTKAFFELLPKNDFQSERAFMTDEFFRATSLKNWTTIRKQVIATAGSTPRYASHALTYYKRGTLLAAVDFWGRGSKPNTFVCGFILWEIPTPNLIGFSRVEQNIVPADVVKKMPVQQAAQLMADWHCPTALIETILGVSVQ